MFESDAGHERGFGDEVRLLSPRMTGVLTVVLAVAFVVVMVLVIRDWISEYRAWRREHPKLFWPPDDGGESYTDEEWEEILRYRDGDGEDDEWDDEWDDEGESDGNDDEWWTP